MRLKRINEINGKIVSWGEVIRTDKMAIYDYMVIENANGVQSTVYIVLVGLEIDDKLSDATLSEGVFVFYKVDGKRSILIAAVSEDCKIYSINDAKIQPNMIRKSAWICIIAGLPLSAILIGLPLLGTGLFKLLGARSDIKRIDREVTPYLSDKYGMDGTGYMSKSA